MKTRGRNARSLLLAVAVALAGSATACTWKAWIPGESSWNPPVVVDPAKLAIQLPLETPYVGELDCYARICDQRFRIVVDEAGQLTIRVVAEPPSQDDQLRLVLESLQGVLAQAGTGRGSPEDVSPLALRRPVEPGTYFVLLQGIGSGAAIPYEITAVLTPTGSAARELEVTPVDERGEPLPPLDPPARLAAVDMPFGGSASYDPAVDYAALRTFRFAPMARPGEGAPEGAVLEQPEDRQVRRFLNDGLVQKGLRPAPGGEEPDITVAFSRGQRTGIWHDLDTAYDRYEIGEALRGEAVSLATLSVDFLETGTGRIAWRATSSQGEGTGDGAGDTQRLREAVAEVLRPFPPK